MTSSVESVPLSSLGRRPELAQLVGIIIADYAYLEFMAFLGFVLVSERPVERLFSEFHSLKSVHRRRELVLSEARGRVHPVLFEALERAWRHFIAAASRRTEIAHCLYLAPGESVLRLRSRDGRAWFEAFNEKVYHRTLRQFRDVSEELLACAVFATGSVERFERRLRDIPRPRGVALESMFKIPEEPIVDIEQLMPSYRRLKLDRLFGPQPMTYLHLVTRVNFEISRTTEI